VKLQILQQPRPSILLRGNLVRVGELSLSYRIKNLKENKNSQISAPKNPWRLKPLVLENPTNFL
jgi:hypothetical protein